MVVVVQAVERVGIHESGRLVERGIKYVGGKGEIVRGFWGKIPGQARD